MIITCHSLFRRCAAPRSLTHQYPVEIPEGGAAGLGPLFGGAAGGLPPPPPPPLRLLLDCSLSPVARKLRMVGIDTKVAGTDYVFVLI